MNTINFHETRTSQSLAMATHKNGKALSRLISAAVVNQHFCNMLLNHPAEAIANGYSGKPFHLEREEQDLVISINATTLPDFAMQLAKHQYEKNRNVNSNGSSYWLPINESLVALDSV